MSETEKLHNFKEMLHYLHLMAKGMSS